MSMAVITVAVVVVSVTVIVVPAGMIIAIVAPAVIAVILVLAVVVAVVVPDLIVVLVAAELMFPAAVAAPVSAFAATGKWTAIAEVRVVIMIDVAVEANGAAEPRSCAKKDAAYEPLRSVIAERCALVRRVIEIAVGADWRDSDAYGDLRVGFLRTQRKTESSNCGQKQNPETLHSILLAELSEGSLPGREVISA